MMDIKGIVPPLVTPLASRDALDHAGLERLIGNQLDAAVDGLFILGTTGEGPSLSARLQRELITATSQLLENKVPLYVGITDTSLVDAIDLAQAAADAGASAVVAAPPFYFPAGQTELQHWFHELADALPLPLLLYNMPSCVRIVIEQPSLATLIDHENIVGLKDSSGDLEYFAQAIELAREKRPGWPIMMGPEALLIDAMRLGAVGGVTGGANLCPKLFTGLFAAIQSGDTARVAELQEVVVALQQLYSFGKYGSSYLKGLKCALELSDICSGLLAAPFDVFKAPELARVEAWLAVFKMKLDDIC
ncbi:MAG: dihydrodipicolinate synthase family protein [Planctomycetaceae bacterium]|nr:dihydrodipicolinate synthase family protein [Planctomycetaceae bacterium]